MLAHGVSGQGMKNQSQQNKLNIQDSLPLFILL